MNIHHTDFNPWFEDRQVARAASDYNHPFRVYGAPTGYVIRPGILHATVAPTGVPHLRKLIPLLVNGSAMSPTLNSNVISAGVSAGHVLLHLSVTDTATGSDAGTFDITSANIGFIAGALPTSTRYSRYIPIAAVAAGQVTSQFIARNILYSPSYNSTIPAWYASGYDSF